MSNVDVIDANVVIKWVLVEELSDRAHSLLEDYTSQRRRFIAPPHLYSEVTNAFHQKLRRQQLTAAEADEALEAFLAFRIQIVGPTDLYRRAMSLARNHDIASIYDSLYVALAEMVEGDLWTDDRGIVNTLKPIFPWVRWIGDYGNKGEEPA